MLGSNKKAIRMEKSFMIYSTRPIKEQCLDKRRNECRETYENDHMKNTIKKNKYKKQSNKKKRSTQRNKKNNILLSFEYV